jgi:hypothetical protein
VFYEWLTVVSCFNSLVIICFTLAKQMTTNE